MTYTVIYVRDGVRHTEEFAVKGSNNSTGLHVDFSKAAIMFIKGLEHDEYKGSFIK